MFASGALTVLPQGRDYPKEIRGYKVERTVVEVKKPERKNQKSGNGPNQSDGPDPNDSSANSEADVDSAPTREQAPPVLSEPTGSRERSTASEIHTRSTQPARSTGERSRVARRVRTNAQPEDRRDPSIGLRFKVLQRDHFKCVLCGDHPARNVECVLHVDHVIPWSKGGKTREDNLRTLCATCNIGRSNRHSD